MPRKTMSYAQWRDIDWQRTTEKIATDLGKATNTVSKMRKKFAPETAGKYITRTRNFTAESKKRQVEQASINGKANQPKATEAAMKSELGGRGELNHRSQNLYN